MGESRTAYRIETERLVIRCYQPSDASMLKTAIDESLEHLRPWMPWAHEEPKPLAEKVAMLRRFRGMFDLEQDFSFGLFDLEEKQVCGGIGLHTRLGPDAREIGYWISAAHANRGLTTEAAGALTKVGFEIEHLARIEIRCDPANTRSHSIAKKLGYVHEATLRERVLRPDGTRRDTMIWSLFASDYPSSPAAALRLRAFDLLGEPLLG